MSVLRRIVTRFAANKSPNFLFYRALISSKNAGATGRFVDRGAVAFGLRQVSSNSASTPENVDETKTKLSKSMRVYLERAKNHEEFMKVQTHEYEIGRRHLANMMGEDPETFTQEDVDSAIEYLLPSGLYERKARPLFKPPSIIFYNTKAAKFDISGRPHHYLFYTGRPIYYEILHATTEKLLALEAYEDKMIASGIKKPEENEKVELSGSQWLSKDSLEKLINEPVKNREYNVFIVCMTRLANHPYSARESEFIMKYRKKLFAVSQTIGILPLKYDDEGVAYMDATGTRKHCVAEVTVRDRGTGKIEINGQDISYFHRIQDREQLMFPLHFTGKLNAVDVKAHVAGPGSSAQVGAIRLAISLALRSFLSTDEVERMRIAGLLSKDVRRKERNKPGHDGARKKYTWKKR